MTNKSNHIEIYYVKIKWGHKKPYWVEVTDEKTNALHGRVLDPTIKEFGEIITFPHDAIVRFHVAHLSGLGSPYIPASESCTILDTIVPESMNYETHIAMRKIKEAVGGNLSEYVAGKLRYSQSEMCKALAAEQVDAVAMAIYNIEARNSGCIIGDQTGIGKGRVAASLIRYGYYAGVQPIFMSEKPNLFSDIYRDLVDIGSASLVPFIVNAQDSKTNVKDKEGNTVYQALIPSDAGKIIKSGKLPKSFDYVLCTYSQFSSAEPTDKKAFLQSIAQDNILIMDEAHNASGASNTGQFLQGVVAGCRGVLFLSGTFAKRPDNMPIYAQKTAMKEANMDSEALVEAIEQGGVALQEVLASELVLEGQMLRRERTFDGVEVNFITLDDLREEHRAICDNITDVIRDMIAFQTDYINPEIEKMNKTAAAEGKQIKERGGTSQAGVNNSPYFSKVFNVFNQMLFSIKADAVADRAIMRLKEGKKPVIAFASTMGSFLSDMKAEDGSFVGNGDLIDADFKTVLQKGLDGLLRYTAVDQAGQKEYKQFDIGEFSPECQAMYYSIVDKVKQSSTGISISPIDRIIQKIEDAGYSVSEVTGRSMMVQFDKAKMDKEGVKIAEKKQKEAAKAGDKPLGKLTAAILKEHYPLCYKMIPSFQKSAIYGSGEHYRTLNDLETIFKALPENTDWLTQQMDKATGIHIARHGSLAMLHYFRGGSDWWVMDYDREDDTYFGYACLNGDWQMAEYGRVSKAELEENHCELDFHFTPSVFYKILREHDEISIDPHLEEKLPQVDKFYSDYIAGFKTKISKAEIEAGASYDLSGVQSTVGMVLTRSKENVNDAFRRFNNNEVDVLLINQSGSTGASAHAVTTSKVPLSEVKQRCMIILQPELNISTEVQKRGRINRTGQEYKPIYDYISSAIPAEKRLVMMLQQKLKSLDANTTSNQNQSEAVLNVDDFLNKYGDKVVHGYLLEHPAINKILNDPLGIEKDNKEGKNIPEDIAYKASGRIAVLSCQEQEDFFKAILDEYKNLVEYLKATGEYNLEVQTMNLEAETTDAKVCVAGKGGDSIFGSDSVVETCTCNVLKKPYTLIELQNLIKESLGDKSAQEHKTDLRRDFKQFIIEKSAKDVAELHEKYADLTNKIRDERGYKKVQDTAALRIEYVARRTDELKIAAAEAIESTKERANNAWRSLKEIFEYFMIGASYNYPFLQFGGQENNVPAIFLGYQIDRNRANPYTPSAVKLRFALSDGHKYMAIVCSGEQGMQIRAIIGSSYQVRSNYLEGWDALTKRHSVNRKSRHIITGNLLQACALYKGNLISYSTIDGSVKKGILMPDNWTAGNKRGEAEVVLPISKARKVILELIPGSEVQTMNGLVFHRNPYGARLVEFSVPKNKANQSYYQDPEILSLCTNQTDGFEMRSGRMVAWFSNENLIPLIDILQKKYSVSMKVNPEQFDIAVDVDHVTVAAKSPATKRAEDQFAADKLRFERRQFDAAQAREAARSGVSPDAAAAAKAKAKAKAKARLFLLSAQF